MTRLLTATLTLALGCGLVYADEPKPADKPTNLNGTYTIVSGEENGKPIPDERIKGAMIIFTDKSVAGTDKDKKEFFSCTYSIDSSKTPWVISMTDATRGAADKDKEDKKPIERMRSTGLIKQDGDTVTIIYTLAGGKAPTEFKTADMQQMFVLKRADKK